MHMQAGNPQAVHDIHARIGQLTRQLHNALSGLGLADTLRSTVGELPDVQSRLAYISRLTGAAADKVLTHVEQARAQQDHVIALCRQHTESSVEHNNSASLINQITRAAHETNTLLTEITLAQDFHDLTGQVIARVIHLASSIEQQLVQLLLETVPKEAQAEPDTKTAAAAPAPAQPLQGPVINSAQSAPDVMTSQTQVDDLLASLGF